MRPWLELLKLRITVASTVTTFVGYVMARGRVDSPLVPVLAGIMLQACGAAALNQVFEIAAEHWVTGVLVGDAAALPRHTFRG